MTIPNSSMITIAQAVVNKYSKPDTYEIPIIQDLKIALECHEQSVRLKLPTFTILLNFSEIYDLAKRAIEQWQEGQFGAECTIMPMLEGAVSVVNVPSSEDMVCSKHNQAIPCYDCHIEAADLLIEHGLVVKGK